LLSNLGHGARVSAAAHPLCEVNPVVATSLRGNKSDLLVAIGRIARRRHNFSSLACALRKNHRVMQSSRVARGHLALAAGKRGGIPTFGT
jgi:hypothetical protein